MKMQSINQSYRTVTREIAEYVNDKLSLNPPKECKFKVGDTVTFTNQYGVSFTGLKVIGFSDGYMFDEYDKYIHINMDCFWFPLHPDELKLESNAPQKTAI